MNWWRVILESLDEWGRPARKLPDCPNCGEDELGVIGPRTIFCYLCTKRWGL